MTARVFTQTVNLGSLGAIRFEPQRLCQGAVALLLDSQKAKLISTKLHRFVRNHAQRLCRGGELRHGPSLC